MIYNNPPPLKENNKKTTYLLYFDQPCYQKQGIYFVLPLQTDTLKNLGMISKHV